MTDFELIRSILNARVYDVACETPLVHMPYLTHRLNNSIWLKREDLQPIFSFKIRGAYNKISHLSEAAKQCGVITASAGNHAQGVALAAQVLGIQALIVMPKTAAEIKVRSVREKGAQILLEGENYDEAAVIAHELAKARGMTYIPAYDDFEVIAGQGTVGVELLKQHPDPLNAIFVPVGGGGLIAGIAAYVKHMRPEIKIIGVEPVGSASMHAALKAKARVSLPTVDLFADGVAAKQVGEIPFQVALKAVDEVVLVDNRAICEAIRDIFEDTRAIAEPSGALALAGLKKYVADNGIVGQSMVAILSGANISFDRIPVIFDYLKGV